MEIMNFKRFIFKKNKKQKKRSLKFNKFVGRGGISSAFNWPIRPPRVKKGSGEFERRI